MPVHLQRNFRSWKLLSVDDEAEFG